MPKIKLKGVRNSDLYGNSSAAPSILERDAATDPEVASFLNFTRSKLSAPGTYGTEAYFTPQIDDRWKGLGESVYDPVYITGNDPTDIDENRAQRQPGILQLANGALKMGTTGITTFLNGTVGFLYGIETGVGNAFDLNGTNEDGSEKTFIQGLWDNDFNRAMSAIQDDMEEIAPNYYSQAELENPWYTNILSANFLGDKVLKNMGFTIGALMAMYVSGGTGIAGIAGKGIQTAAKFVLGNAGKLMNASRGTLAGINSFARGSGQLAHHLVQTAIGASGEASIEAINAVKEGSKDAYRNLEIRRQELINALDPLSPDYYENLTAIDAATEQYKQDIDSKFRDAGNSVYAANLAILSASNALQFTPLIKGGFKRSAKLTDFERRLGERTVGADEWAQGILRGEQASIANTVDKGWGRTIRKATFNSLIEGGEEASQNLASNSRQLQAKARLNLDAADSILGARINPEATDELVDYTKAFSKALYDNFGSPESKGWEEFFLGALTGGMGFIGLGPHRVKNEQGEQMYDPKTHKPITSWKPRSISDWFQGGIMEARRAVNEEYEANQLIVDAVNQRLADPDFIKRTQHAIGSKALASEMEEALDQNDMFKFKNSEIGKLVNDVFFFRDKGMIDEYKAIFKGLTHIDDKTLQQLYTATADPEGNTELSQEDMEAVRDEYQKKAETNLEKIKMIQDYYDFVDQEYRERSQLFKEELAYQYIRLDDTRRRIAELEEKKKSPSKFKANLLGLRDYMSNPTEWDGTTPSRNAYIDNIESDNGLTDDEQNDLERLKRQEKQQQRRIDRAKAKPEVVDLWINQTYAKSKIEAESKDVEGLTTKLKDATTITDIDRIIASADDSVKQEIINRAYQEGDEELKTKLQGQISASTAYTKSKKRLEKIYDKEEAKELNQALQNLLYNVYMSSNMDLAEVKKTLQNIHNELNENSIDTIAKIMPDSYQIFENFVGEENKKEKGIFQDVLEGTIEDVGNGIIASEIWKGQQQAQARARKQQEEAVQRQQKKEEKKRQNAQSYDAAVSNSTYVKRIEGLEAHKDAFEAFGVEDLDTAIQDALEQAGNEGNEKSVKNVLKFVKAVVANGNPQQKIKDLQKRHSGKDGAVDNILDYLEKKYKGNKPSNKKASGNQFKNLMRQLKDADKKGDVATINSIIAQISADPQQYYTQGARDEDFEYISKLEQKYKNKKKNTLNPDEVEWFTPNEVSYEVSEKNGVKTTKFTWWKENKEGKLVPTIGGGLSIDTDIIDESSLDTEEVEKPVLTELREKGGKFTGTIRYSLKGQKGRIEADVKFKEDPTKKTKSGNAQTYIDRMNRAKTQEENDKAANDAAKAGIPEKEWMSAYHRNESRIAKEEEGKEDTTKEEDEDLDVDIEEEIILSEGEIQAAVNKFYKSKHLDPNNLSIEEQQKIIASIEKVLDLVKRNEDIPVELQPYADAILADKDDPVIVLGPENHSTGATADNELNGAFLGLYDVGNVADGRPNKLQDMDADIPNNLKSINYFYGSVQHAEQVQWCIDNILKDLKAKNTPIRVVVDASKPNVLYPAIKATEELKKKAKVRWIVDTNDGEYIIIGTLGFNNSSSAQQSLWQEALDSALEQIPEGTTQGFFVSADDKYTFKVNNIGDGRPAKTHYKTNSTYSIVELVEGDSKRNPQGLTLKNLKWQIIYTDGPKSVHVNNGDRVRGNAHLDAGKVYLLIPTPSGAYYRHPVSPITIDGINKDSELYKQVDKLISTIIRNKKAEDVIKLKDKLVLESDTENRSYLDIYFNDNGIRVKYVPRGSEGPAESLTLSQDEDEAIDQLKEIIYSRVRPFISVTLAHLSSPATIKQLDKAGALQLKGSLGILSYVGANYTVVPYSASTNSKPAPRRRSSLEKTDDEFRYKGQQIFVTGNDYKINGKLVTDAKLIEELDIVYAINNGQYTGESLWKWELKGKGKNKKWNKKPLEGEYFFIEKGSQTVVYHKDARGNITKESPDTAKKILNTRAENQKYATDKAREEAIKSGEAEAGEDINIDIEDDTLEETESNDDRKQKILNENIEKIEVPTITGGTREIKAEKVQYSDLKKGDFVWYSGPGTSTPVDNIRVDGNDQGDVFGYSAGSNGDIILPKDRTYYRKVKQDSSKATISGKSIYQEIMDNEEGSGGLTANFRTLEKSAEKGDITVEEALVFIKNRVKNIKYSDSQLRSALEYLIDKKAPRNEERRKRSLEKAEKELGFHKGDVIEDNQHRRYTVLGYTWSNSSLEGSKEQFNDNDYLEGEPTINLQSAPGIVESMPAGMMYTNWKERRITSYTKIDTTTEARKQDAVKRATYDLEQKLGVKVGDTISLKDGSGEAIITSLTFFDSITPAYSKYSYSDFPGTVVANLQLKDESTMIASIDAVFTDYQKVNKQSQKPLINQDNSEISSTFVARLLDSKQDTLALEDILYDKAASIAEEKGIDFDEDCSIKELIEWFKTNAKFDLTSIPNNADTEIVKEIIDKCK